MIVRYYGEAPEWAKNAKSGDFVVVVKGIPAIPKFGVEKLEVGKVYEIKDVKVIADGFPDSGQPAFDLVGYNVGYAQGQFLSVHWFALKPVSPLPNSIKIDAFIGKSDKNQKDNMKENKYV